MAFTHDNSKGTTYHLNCKDVTLQNQQEEYKEFTFSLKIQEVLLAISLMDTMLKKMQELDYHS